MFGIFKRKTKNYIIKDTSKFDALQTKLAIEKRINNIPKEELQFYIKLFSEYDILFYNHKGEFDYSIFQQDCRRTLNLLAKNEIPNPCSGIQNNFCVLASNIQKIVGTQNIGKFLCDWYGDKDDI